MSSEQKTISALRNEDGTLDARNLNRNTKETHMKIDKTECYRIRVSLLYGATLRGYVGCKDEYSTSAAHLHATGECAHSDVGAPALRHKREDEQPGTGKWIATQAD